MDGGYFLFSLIKHPDKYLGFNRNGKPINYEKPKIDKQCRKIMTRITESISNGPTSTIDNEMTTTGHNLNHRHKSSTRINQRTHSNNRIETSKSRVSSPHTSSKRRKLQLQSQPQHHVRHHHDQQPLRSYHTIIDNKVIDSNSSTKQLGNDDLNAIYNRNNSGVNIESESKVNRHVKKPHKGVVDSRNSNNDNLENNNDTNNCTDEGDDKRKIAKGRNANDKPNNKCNNNNRRQRKNNENGRHSRRPSQKSSSHKHPQAKEA